MKINYFTLLAIMLSFCINSFAQQNDKSIARVQKKQWNLCFL